MQDQVRFFPPASSVLPHVIAEHLWVQGHASGASGGSQIADGEDGRTDGQMAAGRTTESAVRFC